MKASLKSEYDATRDFSNKSFRAACYAPFTALYFDTYGSVRVCCHNVKYRVGDVSRQTIDEIWNGEPLAQLRNALTDYDLRRGCEFCAWRLTAGFFSSLSTRSYDQFAVRETAPRWPQTMEFSISNSCNLECIMCNGNASSAIRAHREKLPPMHKAYGERFLAELDPFLPHLQRAKFLGGEPFLQQECFRIWEVMIAKRLRTSCHVTTNGTQWNARVERVLEGLPVEIAISMDGASRETVEMIRFRADYDTVMANFRRFHSYSNAHGRPVTLTFCLMRQNWHELGAFCRFADDWGCPVFVNTVRTPPQYGLYSLPKSELKVIVRSMEMEAATLLPKLHQNLAVWLGEFERLRTFVRRNCVGAPDVARAT